MLLQELLTNQAKIRCNVERITLLCRSWHFKVGHKRFRNTTSWVGRDHITRSHCDHYVKITLKDRITRSHCDHYVKITLQDHIAIIT
jgi:hypothetical protein